MSLGDLNPRTRRLLKLHGWLLTLWCIGVAMLANWLLLHAAGISSPPHRFAASALVMYLVGLLFGVRVWLAWFSRQAKVDGGLAHADPSDRAAFGLNQASRAERARKSWDWGDALGSLADLFSADEALLLLIVPALVLMAWAVLSLLGMLPLLLVDGIAALLAEVALQFVFGTLLARRVLRPRAHEEAFVRIAQKTWIAGVLLTLLSAAAGYALVWLDPSAVTLRDLFR